LGKKHPVLHHLPGIAGQASTVYVSAEVWNGRLPAETALLPQLLGLVFFWHWEYSYYVISYAQ